MKSSIELNGEKIILRTIAKDDLEFVRSLRNEPNNRKQFFYQNEISENEQLTWFNNYSDKENDYMFVIYNRDDERVGCAALYGIDKYHESCEFGRMMIDRDHRGKNYGKEAIKLILKYGFEFLNLHRIYLQVFSDNLSAKKLYEKCGFIEEGQLREAFKQDNKDWRDITIMSILIK